MSSFKMTGGSIKISSWNPLTWSSLTGLPNTLLINAQVGTMYTLLTSDNGKIVTMNNPSDSTVLVLSGLGVGFSCTIIQLGEGQVTLSASGVAMNSYLSSAKIAGQHGKASLIAYSSDVFNLNGNLV